MHRRAAIIISLGLIGVTACSGSESSSGAPVDGTDVEFCDAISAIQSAEFELEETFGPEARQLFSDVQASAPPGIADDVATVIGTLDAVAGLGISMDDDDPAAVEAAFEILLDPDYTDANERLTEYTSEVCGITLGEGDDAGIDLDDLEGFDDV